MYLEAKTLMMVTIQVLEGKAQLLLAIDILGEEEN